MHRSRFSTLYYSDAYMKSVHITQVHPETINALKRLARSNQPSLQGELRAILERAASAPKPPPWGAAFGPSRPKAQESVAIRQTPRVAPPDTARDEFKLVTVTTGYTDSWSREEIYGADGR